MTYATIKGLPRDGMDHVPAHIRMDRMEGCISKRGSTNAKKSARMYRLYKNGLLLKTATINDISSLTGIDTPALYHMNETGLPTPDGYSVELER